MREILFRGKRVDNGEWVEGYYVKATHHWHEHGVHEDWIVGGASQNGGWFTVNNRYAVVAETVGQFTGVIDRNDNKIFEGDIVDAWNCCGEKHVVGKPVGWSKLFCSWESGDCNGMYGDNVCSYEVIGNIFDSPALLFRSAALLRKGDD